MEAKMPDYYSYLPYETAGLYKRYSIDIELPRLDAEGAADVSSHMKKAEEMAASAGSGIADFDILVTNSGARSRRREVSIKKGAPKIGMYESRGGIGDFTSSANHHIEINIGRERQSRIRMLVVNSMHISLPIHINVGEGADLSLMEFYTSVSEHRSVVVPTHEISAGKGSHVEISIIHNGNERSELLGLMNGYAAGKARLKVNTVYSGSLKSKSISILRAQESGHVEANEIVYGTGLQQFDINTFIINEGQNSTARLESSAVLDGSARCVFKGFAKINKWAKGAKSKVSERGMLLSEDARMDALPDMSIDYSDGVSATHSAATAPPDDEQTFYLMSRGISSGEARRLSIMAFMSKHLSGIDNPFANETASTLMLRRIRGEAFENIPRITSRDVWHTKAEPWNGTE